MAADAFPGHRISRLSAGWLRFFGLSDKGVTHFMYTTAANNVHNFSNQSIKYSKFYRKSFAIIYFVLATQSVPVDIFTYILQVVVLGICINIPLKEKYIRYE